MDPGQLADLVLARSALAGDSRLVCVDGPAGSGKTTLAERLARELRAREASAAVVHMDDLYEGWNGLPGVVAIVEERIVGPLSRGAAAGYDRYDWGAAAYAEHHDVPPSDVVVLEGVGSWRKVYADLVSVLVWVEAPERQRLQRGLARDGAEQAGHWHRWMQVEQVVLHAEGTKQHADVLVDGAAVT